MATLYTVGHSTRTLDEFLRVLKAHEITALTDIRAFPMSRRLPHFNRENLDGALRAEGILYHWIPALGGRRKRIFPKGESPNTALRSDSFRNYADYMLTPEFRAGIDDLLAFTESHRVAYMCAERVYFHCHRMLVSDYLVSHQHEVLHIDNEGPAKPHNLLDVARLRDGKLIYNGGELF